MSQVSNQAFTVWRVSSSWGGCVQAWAFVRTSFKREWSLGVVKVQTSFLNSQHRFRPSRQSMAGHPISCLKGSPSKTLHDGRTAGVGKASEDTGVTGTSMSATRMISVANPCHVVWP